MKKEFLTYEQALALKELGFKEPCFGYYDGNLNLQFMYNGIPEKFTEKRMGLADSVWVGWISAPLYQQALRWFIEKYELYGTIKYGYNEFDKSIYLFPCINGIIVGNDSFKTQEEAELECLKKLIEIVKEKK